MDFESSVRFDEESDNRLKNRIKKSQLKQCSLDRHERALIFSGIKSSWNKESLE